MRVLFAAIAAAALALAHAGSAAAQTLVRDTEIELMLRDYTNPLLVAAGLDPRDVKLFIIADPSINAMVTGGQNIYMHTGLIVESQSPAELRGVLAHETGHIAGAHLARMSEGIRNAAVPAFAAIGLGIIAALAGEGGAAGALITSSQQFMVVSFATYTRTQESVSDQMAVRYLEASGYSGRGLLDFFERNRVQEVLSMERRFPYFRSHPFSSERLNALRQSVTTASNYNTPESPEEEERLRRIQAKIYGFTASPSATFLRYPETDQSLPARYARSVAYYQAGRLDRARQEIDTLIEEEPDNPFFAELYGQMLFESSRAEESIAHHQRSVDLMPNAPLFRVNLAMSMLATEDPDLLEPARAHLRFALNLEPDNSFAWYQLSIVHERTGNIALAQLAVAEQAYAVGDRRRTHMFATRAQEGLESGTPAWFRASELQAVAQPSEAEMREIRREQRRTPNENW